MSRSERIFDITGVRALVAIIAVFSVAAIQVLTWLGGV